MSLRVPKLSVAVTLAVVLPSWVGFPAQVPEHATATSVMSNALDGLESAMADDEYDAWSR